MCGIAGYFGPREIDAPAMLASLRHRGPDASGAWHAALSNGTHLQLLHTRLKIIDLSEAAAQPMLLRETGGTPRWGSAEKAEAATAPVQNPEDLLTLIFNGEIYNFRDLRTELEARGHRFRSSGDTEVLLRGYAEWGVEVFARLDGMFAMAVFDGPRRRLVLARDHAGIKPLYHARTGDGGLLFASEVRAITRSGRCGNHLDAVALGDYLRLGSCQEPRTLIEGVRAFPPGHYGILRLDEGSPSAFTAEPFWLPERIAVDQAADSRPWREAHRECLTATVREQLVSDVPLGVFLSGGVDSTLLLELAAASRPGKIVAFTLGAGLAEHDEGAIAARSARRAGVDHLLVQLEAGETVSWVQDGLAAMDQPSADGLNTYLVSRAARRKGLVAVLSGSGADELHGVYGHVDRLTRPIRALQAAGRWRGSVERLAVFGTRLSRGRLQAERLAELLAAAPSAWRVDQEKRRFLTPTQIARLWPLGARAGSGWAPPFADSEAFHARGLGEQIRLSEIRGYLLNTLLRDCDWATMANHQELRVPFLGRKYMECVLRAPERATAARAVTKPQLVALLSPEARRQAGQPKRGFNLDYLGWLGGPLKAEFLRTGQALGDMAGFYFDPRAKLDELRKSHSQKEARRAWALLALGNYLATNI